ncbi:MAG: MBOAT family protein [Pirellulaceae bacterium]
MLCSIASYVFYGWWDYRFTTLLLWSTMVDYVVGRLLEGARQPKMRRALLWCSVVSNLGVLAVFKYFDFFAENVQRVAAQLGVTVDWPTLHLVLPVGISFYTFQTLSYTIDVYRQRLPAERDLWRFATFVAFFPQLVAGPIVRAHDFLPQLARDREITWDGIVEGFGLVLLGFFKKVVVADSVAIVVDHFFGAPQTYTSLNAMIVVVLYAFQIYGDFSGYSDIAIGLGRMMGFALPRNFQFPYFANSFSEFWRRWHISLSTWLRDYLYIPLGGNRSGTVATYRNLMLTMVLGGLWHGAHWTFILWGTIHGILLTLQRWATPRTEFKSSSQSSAAAFLGSALFQLGRMAIVFVIVCLTWVMFRRHPVGDSLIIYARIASLDDFSPGALQDRIPLVKGCALVSILFIGEAVAQHANHLPCVWHHPLAKIMAYACLLWSIALFGTFAGNAFIYFQF